jgi:hypothetical protein
VGSITPESESLSPSEDEEEEWLSSAFVVTLTSDSDDEELSDEELSLCRSVVRECGVRGKYCFLPLVRWRQREA